MAPSLVSKQGAVMASEHASFNDIHIFPGVPGRWMPDVPVALDAMGVDVNDPGAVVAVKQAAAAAGLVLEFGVYEFELPPEPEDDRVAALKKLRVPALLDEAKKAGVSDEQLEALSQTGVTKAQIIDAIVAVAEED